MPLIGGRSRAVCKIRRSGKPWIEVAKKRLHHNVLAIALANVMKRATFPAAAASALSISGCENSTRTKLACRTADGVVAKSPLVRSRCPSPANDSPRLVPRGSRRDR
jgi:hypothetical protein